MHWRPLAHGIRLCILDPYKIIFCSFKFLPILSKTTAYLNDNEVNTVFVNARDLRTSATKYSQMVKLVQKAWFSKTILYEEFLVWRFDRRDDFFISISWSPYLLGTHTILMEVGQITIFRKKIFSVKRPFKKTFGQMNFRSNDLSVKWPFGQMTIFSKKAFGQMNFRSNDQFSKKAFGQMNLRLNVISVIWLFFPIWFSVKWPFSKYFRSNDLINFVFGQMTYFGKMNFRSNGVRSNGVSVKWPFDQMVFGQTVFGGVSVKWRSVKKFGKMTFR
jgi:hypothetical protein